jgi:H+/Cl- antiporter ClcA
MGFAGLAQVAIEHIGSYIELLGRAAAEYRASFLKRALYAIAALVAMVATLMSAWITGLVLLWESPWRTTYCVVSVLLCLLAATALTLLAIRRPAPGPSIRILREEASQDLALLQEWRRAQ